jgi:hypothetical protein
MGIQDIDGVNKETEKRYLKGEKQTEERKRKKRA